MNVCFVAHPDDDALWFGNTEMLFGFDVKVILTYKPNEQRAMECIEWTNRCDKNCELIFLEFKDDRHAPLGLQDITTALSLHGVPRKIDTLYTHGLKGEYGHAHHISVHKSAMSYFTYLRAITPHYPEENGSAQFEIHGDKFSLIKTTYKSQVAALAKNLRRYCDTDYLEVFFSE